jgi:hypothetical protein
MGFLSVFIFQGFWILILVQNTVGDRDIEISYALALCVSCLIESVYAFSQMYQHKQAVEEGVTSIRSLLG